MKKRKKLFLLSTIAVLLVGLTSASIVVKNDSLGTFDNPINKQQSNESHDITVNVDTSITINVDSKATTGQIVEVSVTYDSEKVILNSLLANGLEMAKVSDTSYYFLMPDSDVSITADYKVIKTNKVISLSDEVIVTMLSEENFAAGDTVKFKLGLPQDSKYSIETYFEAGLYSSDENTFTRTLDVEYSQNDRSYSVEIPKDYDSNLWIEPILVEKYFTITENDSNISSIDIVSSEGDVIDSYVDYATADTLLRVKLTDTTSLLGKGVTIVETNQTYLDEDGDSYVTFQMPARNITLAAVTEINYVPFEVNLEQAPHTTVTAYTLTEDDTYQELEELKAVPYETVYLSFETSDENYKVTEVSGTYGSYSSSLSIREDSQTGYKYFTMPNGDDVTITVIESAKQSITLNNSEHISLSLFNKVDDHYVEATGGFYGDELYLKATINDASYSIQTISATYNRVGSDSTSNISLTLEDDGYYSFTIPNNSENIQITVNELDATKYQDYSFVGDYAGANIFTSSSYKISSTTSTTYNISLNADGSFKFRSENTRYIQSIEGDQETGLITDTTGRKVGAYSSNVFISHYNLGQDVLNAYDFAIMAKKEASGDTFTFNYSLVPLAGESTAYHFFIQIYRNDILLDCIYLDTTNRATNQSVFHLKDIRFVDTETTSDIVDASSSTAVYEVYEGDTLLGTVSNDDKTFTLAQ